MKESEISITIEHKNSDECTAPPEILESYQVLVFTYCVHLQTNLVKLAVINHTFLFYMSV
jgi:hypothetical protein